MKVLCNWNLLPNLHKNYKLLSLRWTFLELSFICSNNLPLIFFMFSSDEISELSNRKHQSPMKIWNAKISHNLPHKIYKSWNLPEIQDLGFRNLTWRVGGWGGGVTPLRLLAHLQKTLHFVAEKWQRLPKLYEKGGQSGDTQKDCQFLGGLPYWIIHRVVPLPFRKSIAAAILLFRIIYGP